MNTPFTIVIIVFITCLLTTSVYPHSSKLVKRPCPLCDDSRDVTSVKIPRAMPLATFTKYWTDRLTHQVYFGWTRTIPTINVEIIIPRTSPTTFLRKGQGFIGLPVNTCFSFESTLATRDNSATFYTNGTLSVIFSSCPTQYYWYLQCSNWVEGQKRCPIDNTNIALTVLTLDPTFILPWDAATKDLRNTSLNFATKSITFGYTYGANVDCDSLANLLVP